MRLWHQDLIKHLPRQQLLGQHRECCALRGAGWGRNHSVVNYVFSYEPTRLVAYHYLVMEEMQRRGYHPDPIWENVCYRGKAIGYQEDWCDQATVNFIVNLAHAVDVIPIYSEHNAEYLQECLDNLKEKGIEIEL